MQGERAQLSAREFALLHALLERPGAILSRDQLENRIYGWGEEVSSNAVDVLIHGMRRKLGPDSDPQRARSGLAHRCPPPAASPGGTLPRRLDTRHECSDPAGDLDVPAGATPFFSRVSCRSDVLAASRAPAVAGAAVSSGRSGFSGVLLLELQPDGERVHGRPDAAAGAGDGARTTNSRCRRCRRRAHAHLGHLRGAGVRRRRRAAGFLVAGIGSGLQPGRALHDVRIAGVRVARLQQRASQSR